MTALKHWIAAMAFNAAEANSKHILTSQEPL